MNLRDELQELKTDSRSLRKFGLMVGGVCAALGCVFLLRHRPFYGWLLWPGLTLTLLGAVLPRLLKPVYLAWMTLAILLGFVVSHLILTLLFFLVFTPVGLVARLLGKDFLALKLDRGARSYWIPRERRGPSNPADYERQF